MTGAAATGGIDATGRIDGTGSTEGTAAPAPANPAVREPVPLPTWFEPAVRIAGAIVALALGAVLGMYAAFLVPLWGWGVRLPVSLVLALVGNPALVWFAFRVTGRRLAGLLPAAAWCLVFLAAATRTAEGDLLLTSNNWVGLSTLVAGPVAFAVAIYALVLRDVRTGWSAPTMGRPATGFPARAASPAKPAASGKSASPAAPAKPAASSAAGPVAPSAGRPDAAPAPVRPRRRRPGSTTSRRR